MQNEMQNDALNGVGFLLGMLWVLALMAAMLVAYIGRRTNERKEQTYGYELEVIKTLHTYSNDANHSLANFLTKVKGQGGWEAYYESYNHHTQEHTKIVTDGSLNDGGIELVSPPLTGIKERRHWLSTVANKLSGLVKTDRSCGVHVHIGLKRPEQAWGEDSVYTIKEARMISAKTVVIYTIFKDAINSLLPDSRRRNRYARHSDAVLEEAHRVFIINDHEQSADWWEDMYGNTIHTRYQAVNTTSLRKYGTIEFRQHGGSTNATKIDAWTQLCSAFVARAATISHGEMKSVLKFWGDTGSTTLEDLAHFLGLSMRGQLMTYFQRRATQLKGIPLDPKCETCSREDCAGCQSQRSQAWADIHDEDTFFNCGNEDCYGCSNGGGRSDCEYNASALGLGLVWLAVAFGPLVAALALVINCGIGAIHSRGKDYKSNEVATRLWTGLTSRGKQAAGIGWIDEDCLREDGTLSQFWHLKEPSHAGSLTKAMKRLVKPSTWWAMFHTRFATHGENNSDNAHPHFSSCNTVCLVHNGVISNWEQGWDVLEAKHGRKQMNTSAPEVDSQVVAEMLAVGGIEMVIKHLQGTMSLIWADVRDPAGTLHFWTNGENPLHFGRLDNPTGDIMVASTESHWIEGAGNRAMTEPQRVIKTRKFKVKPKFGKPYFRTDQVRDKTGKLVYTTKPVPINHWAAVIGKHYTITPEGKIGGDMTENWVDTTYGRMYSWSSFSTPKPLKATGNQDVCSVPTNDPTGQLKATDKDVHQTVYDIMDTHGGWPSFKGHLGQELHGYCGRLHQGITPTGERYDLRMHIQPWLDDLDRMELLQGLFFDEGSINDWVTDLPDYTGLFYD